MEKTTLEAAFPGPHPVLQGPDLSSASDWWCQHRKTAWEAFQALPMPKRKDEDWRFANIQSIRLEPFLYGVNEGLGDLTARSKLPFDCAATAVIGNDRLLYLSPLPNELTAKGVVWEPISLALEHHGELIRDHLAARESKLGSAKFSALHAAFRASGMFLFVPSGVEIERPFAAWHWLAGPRASTFPYSLMILEDNSRATLLDLYNSAEDVEGLAVGMTKSVVGPGASLRHLCAQQWSEQTLSFQLQTASVARDATVKMLNVNLGGAISRAETECRMLGPGGSAEILGLSLGHANQEFDQRTLQSHDAPHCWSDLLYKNTLNHRAKAIFSGLIRVAPGACQTDAYQTNRNLLLSPDAEADSMPGLEILNDDVKCSHGATTGEIPIEQIFYMRTRGIGEERAKHLIAAGFFEEVLDRFDDGPIGALLCQKIEEKFARSERLSYNQQPEDEKASEDMETSQQMRKLQGSV